MKTWWDIIKEKRPGLEKYPGGMIKPKVLAAEQGNVEDQTWMKTMGLWYSEFDT